MIEWPTIQAAFISWVRTSSGLGAENVWWRGQKKPIVVGQYITLRIFSVGKIIGTGWTIREENHLVIPDDVVESANTGTDSLVLTAHGLLTGDGPVTFTSTGTLPGGLSLATNYWVNRLNANEIRLGLTAQDAWDGVFVNINSSGTGVHTLHDGPTTFRINQELQQKVQGIRECVLDLQCFSGSAVGLTMPLATLENVISSLELDSVDELLSNVGIVVFDTTPVQSTDGFMGSTVFEPRATAQVRFYVSSEVSDFTTFIENGEFTNDATGDMFEISIALE